MPPSTPAASGRVVRRCLRRRDRARMDRPAAAGSTHLGAAPARARRDPRGDRRRRCRRRRRGRHARASDPFHRRPAERLHPRRDGRNTHYATVGSGRYDFWRVSLKAFLGSPIGGLGQDNFADYYILHRRTLEDPAWPHSIEMRLLAMTGIVGSCCSSPSSCLRSRPRFATSAARRASRPRSARRRCCRGRTG